MGHISSRRSYTTHFVWIVLVSPSLILIHPRHPPNSSLSDLASPLSGPPAQSPPTSEHLDFAITSTPRDTLSPATPLSPPKIPVTQRLTLPTNTITTQPTATSSSEGKTEEKEEDKQGLRVLLVEDNEINLKLLIATMRKLKLEHATATNGLEAFNSYKEKHGKFDVVFMGTFPLPSASFPSTTPLAIYIPPFSNCSCSRLTSAPDISMPIMSGIESTRHIRRFEKEHGLEPVALIALTGAANPNTRQEAFSSGVDLFLTKPVPMKALRGMLEDLRREGRAAFAG